MEKIIFLDIDGVLNVNNQGRDNYGHIFHKPFVDNLKHIIDSTGAKLVISSTWRQYMGLDGLKEMWKDRKLCGEIIGETPDCMEITSNDMGEIEFLDMVERGHEIEMYLMGIPESNEVKYVILDDMDGMLEHQLPNFVKCDNNMHHPDAYVGKGLTRACADEAILILNKE